LARSFLDLVLGKVGKIPVHPTEGFDGGVPVGIGPNLLGNEIKGARPDDVSLPRVLLCDSRMPATVLCLVGHDVSPVADNVNPGVILAGHGLLLLDLRPLHPNLHDRLAAAMTAQAQDVADVTCVNAFARVAGLVNEQGMIADATRVLALDTVEVLSNERPQRTIGFFRHRAPNRAMALRK